MERSDETLLDQSELAAHLKVNRKTVARMVAEGRLPPPVRYGGLVRWRWGVIREWHRAMEVLEAMKITRHSDGGEGFQGTPEASSGTSGPGGGKGTSGAKDRR